MIIEESNLKFDFDDEFTAIKFDDCHFYRKYFNVFPHSKGIDVIASSNDTIILMEIKNCMGHESENRWRIHTDNAKINTIPTNTSVMDRESVDIETALKTAMTFACLSGAHTKRCDAKEELQSYINALQSTKIAKNDKKILVILFLEGNFDCESRSKKTIMQKIQTSINKKLKWLNCRISVVDLNTYNAKYFSTERI